MNSSEMPSSSSRVRSVPRLLLSTGRSSIVDCLEYWAFEILVLLAGMLPKSEESTALIAMCVNTESIAYMITFGFSAAVSTRVSNEIGAGKPVQAKNAVSVTLKLAIVFAAILVISLVCGHNIWAGAFSSIPRIKQGFASMTPLLAASVLLDAAQGVLSGVSRGCGWQHFGAWTNLAAFYGIGVPISCVLAFKFDLDIKGLWMGLICGLFSQVLLITLYSCWSKIAVLEPPADDAVHHP